MNAQEYIRTIASHYPDSDSIHRILEYASVDIINVDIEGKPLNTWFMALKEVVNQDKLPDFITAISAEYPALKLNDEEQHELKKFLLKKTNTPEEKKGSYKKYESLFLKIGIPVMLLVGYLIFNSIRKAKLSDTDSPIAIQLDSSSTNAVEFVTLLYKDEPFDFPANKNILQLKQYILATKEGLRNIDAGKSQLSFLGKLLADELMISEIHWIKNKNLELAIDSSSKASGVHVDVFLQNIRLDDPLIFMENQSGYVTELLTNRTRLWVPKYVGDHNLEIYFKDSLAIVPLHMEYSTQNISIMPGEFRKSAKKIERINRQ